MKLRSQVLLFPFLLSSKELHFKLITAAKEGDAKVIASLLRDRRLDVNFHEPKHGGTALYYACQRGHTDAVAALLRAPLLNVNSEIAPKSRSLIATSVIDDYRYPSRVYWTPLHVACARGFTDVVKLLLKHPGINVNLVSNSMTPLHAAIRNGQRAVIEVLMKHGKGLDVNRLAGGSPPLHFACEVGSESAVEILLRSKAVCPSARDWNGASALQVALGCDEINIASMIRDRELRRLRKSVDDSDDD